MYFLKDKNNLINEGLELSRWKHNETKFYPIMLWHFYLIYTKLCRFILLDLVGILEAIRTINSLKSESFADDSSRN